MLCERAPSNNLSVQYSNFVFKYRTRPGKQARQSEEKQCSSTTTDMFQLIRASSRPPESGWIDPKSFPVKSMC